MSESIWVWFLLAIMMIVSVIASGVGVYKITEWLLGRNGRRVETSSSGSTV